MPDWIQVTICTGLDAGELLGALNHPHAAGAWQEDGRIHLYWPAAQWTAETHELVRQTVVAFGGSSHADIAVVQLPGRDWNAEWARAVKPLRIGRHVVVRPSWEVGLLAEGDVELIIDPKQAFGTGHHATTQLMIEMLEKVIQGGESVLDLGTGTGILAMAAIRMGARSALGIDNDPLAIECARGYAKENRFGSELQLRLGSWAELEDESKRPWDVIVGNLDRETILEAAGWLNRHLGGGARLLLSGLLVEQQDEVLRAFTETGASVRRQRRRDEWVALELATAESSEGDESSVHQINVSDGGVPKLPVTEARITRAGVSGDRQRSLKVHGGPDRAVCLYSWELIKALQREGHTIYPGSSGENLTLSGLQWADLKPGDCLSVGDAVTLEVSSYTAPCEHNARWFLNGDYPRMSQKRHPGWSRLYARVLTEGVVRVGDTVKLVRSSQFKGR